MLCQKCGKNQGEGYFRCFSQGKWQTVWLCSACAMEEEAIPCREENGPALTGLPFAASEEGKPEERVCRCGTREEEVRRTGRPGCAHCYETFRDLFAPLILQLQGADRHQGRAPRAQEGRQNVLRLRRLLRQAVEREEFEQAALLRDELRQMEHVPKEGRA